MGVANPAQSLPNPAQSLPLRDIRSVVGPAVQRGADRTWSLGDLDWPAIQPDSLTENDRSIVRFITFIEDHIPGYLTWLLDAFPIVGEDIEISDFCVNREYFRFFVTWAADEERHAAALTRYQVEAGMAEPDDLLRELAAEGRKRFELPYEHPLQAFTYTMIQEKATQLFYQRFKGVAAEPVLQDLLQRLSRDEARHFALYSQLVEAYLRREQANAVPYVKDVLSTFRMPLSETLTGYWRWSLRVADSVGYDHAEAYQALERLVSDVVDAPGALDDDGLMSMVTAIRRLP
jgi:hypothetical protein